MVDSVLVLFVSTRCLITSDAFTVCCRSQRDAFWAGAVGVTEEMGCSLGVTHGSSTVCCSSADLPSEVNACLLFNLWLVKGTSGDARER